MSQMEMAVRNSAGEPEYLGLLVREVGVGNIVEELYPLEWMAHDARAVGLMGAVPRAPNERAHARGLIRRHRLWTRGHSAPRLRHAAACSTAFPPRTAFRQRVTAGHRARRGGRLLRS